MEFQSFGKIMRLSKPVVITEKLDGTNAQIYICGAEETGWEGTDQPFQDKYALGFKDGWAIYAGSRNRWITLENDNFGFALWVKQNQDELLKLGPGRHFGEWWGVGIQRGYGLHERRFSLFNVGKWTEGNKPKCCHIVPILTTIEDFTEGSVIATILNQLKDNGSYAAPGYMNPEGIIIYHTAAQVYFKKTFERDRGKYE